MTEFTHLCRKSFPRTADPNGKGPGFCHLCGQARVWTPDGYDEEDGRQLFYAVCINTKCGADKD